MAWKKDTKTRAVENGVAVERRMVACCVTV